jgi:RNA polymerase II subunit A-like phosphatase
VNFFFLVCLLYHVHKLNNFINSPLPPSSGWKRKRESGGESGGDGSDDDTSTTTATTTTTTTATTTPSTASGSILAVRRLKAKRRGKSHLSKVTTAPSSTCTSGNTSDNEDSSLDDFAGILDKALE